MTFDEILAQIIDLLKRQGRVSYGALKRRYAFDDAYLEDLKDEIIHAQQLAVDEDNRVLVWVGEEESATAPPPAPGNPGTRRCSSHRPSTRSPVLHAQTPCRENSDLAQRVGGGTQAGHGPVL